MMSAYIRRYTDGGGLLPLAVGMAVPVRVYQFNIVVLLSLNESRPACHLLPALGRAWERSQRSAYKASPPESPRTLWLYVPFSCKWHRYAGSSRRGKSSGRDSRRCRSSLLSLGMLSCGLVRPAVTVARVVGREGEEACNPTRAQLWAPWSGS